MHSLPTYYAQKYAGILPSCLVVDNSMLEMEVTNLEYLFVLKLLYPKSSATYSKTADKLLSLLHNYIMLTNRTIMNVELSPAFLVYGTKYVLAKYLTISHSSGQVKGRASETMLCHAAIRARD